MKKPKIHSTQITQPLILRATLMLLFAILVLDCFSQATTVEHIKLKKRNEAIYSVSAPPRLNDAGDKMMVKIESGIEIYKKSDVGEWVFFEKLPFDTHDLIHFGNDLVVTHGGFGSFSYSQRENGFWTKPRTMEENGNHLNIMILDACRNNPFRGFSRSGEQGLSMVAAPKGSYVVYATKPGSVASDGVGKNGLFTSKLLKYMNTPNLNIEQVFKLTASEVAKDSDDRQRPWISSDYTGDFFFFQKQ